MPESMEKRILLSFALSFLVLLIFYQFFSPPPPASDPDAAAPPPAAAEVEVAAPGAGAAFGEASFPAPVASPSPSEVRAAQAETATLENPVYSLRVSNRGGVLESIRLVDYTGAGGAPLELLDANVDGALGWPLELATGDPDVDEGLRSGLWVLESDARRARFDYAAAGVEAFKEVRLHETGYELEFSAGVRRSGQEMPFSVVWQGSFGDQATDYSPGAVNAVFFEDGGFDRLNVTDFAAGDPLPVTAYLGVEDQYFLAMFRSAMPALPEVRSLSLPGPEAGDEIPIPRIEFPYAGGLGIYVGPKQRSALGEVDPALASIIDYGFFQILAQPLLSVLLWIHGWVGNFGWSIILMTLLVNALLFPLRLKQQLSMLKMQKIQPQMRTLQDRYKKLKPNDPRRQEVQSEMMGLYSKHGVNPLGGCLPMVLQMPIFIAIFQLLRTAIELRQAPWVFWVQDLSAYDPYYVLPVFMGISMVASQRLTPTTMDPAQARMMMFMPLMFMVFMIRAQSGLVLYWLTSQLVGVGQQLLIRRYWAPEGKKGTGPPPDSQDGGDSDPPPKVGEAPPTAADPSRRKRRRKR